MLENEISDIIELIKLAKSEEAECEMEDEETDTGIKTVLRLTKILAEKCESKEEFIAVLNSVIEQN